MFTKADKVFKIFLNISLLGVSFDTLNTSKVEKDVLNRHVLFVLTIMPSSGFSKWKENVKKKWGHHNLALRLSVE